MNSSIQLNKLAICIIYTTKKDFSHIAAKNITRNILPKKGFAIYTDKNSLNIMQSKRFQSQHMYYNGPS